MRYSAVPAGSPVKSMMTSRRSATAMVALSTRTGFGMKPPSVPIIEIGSAAGAGRAAVGLLATLSMTTRVLHALSRRNRYRRGSTVSIGQVRPLTTIVLPKNSGFQIGGTSVVGMYGPPAGTSPKKSRLVGKNSDPSELNER